MNVLVLMVDELSWWALGHSGGAAHTPNIDALAARGMRFSNAYTPSPICVPARAAIATGRYVYEIANWSSAEPYTGEPRGWAHAVREAGLDCVSIGKLHYCNETDDTGFSTQLEPLHVLNGEGWVQALLRKPVHPYDNAESLAKDVGSGDTDYHAYDRRVTKAACEWLREPGRQDQTWSAFVSFLAPHFPLIAPARDYALYDATQFEDGPQDPPDHPILQELHAYFDHDRFFTPESRGMARAAYYGLCTFVDRQVGKVLAALDETGQTDDTLIIFTSDHGEMLGEKGFWTKSVMYDSAARVPLIVAGPDIVSGDWSHPVSLIDIAPTVCAALGIDATFKGFDLRAPHKDRDVISEYHDGGCSAGFAMLRWDDWKLVAYAEGHPAQLFNLETDPSELHDLSLLEPGTLRDGLARLSRHFDLETVNAQAHQDQAEKVASMGGRDAVIAKGQFDYTPAG